MDKDSHIKNGKRKCAFIDLLSQTAYYHLPLIHMNTYKKEGWVNSNQKYPLFFFKKQTMCIF
jgi:hypothetical protein